jgi:hypothetical protein
MLVLHGWEVCWEIGTTSGCPEGGGLDDLSDMLLLYIVGYLLQT